MADVHFEALVDAGKFFAQPSDDFIAEMRKIEDVVAEALYDFAGLGPEHRPRIERVMDQLRQVLRLAELHMRGSWARAKKQDTLDEKVQQRVNAHLAKVQVSLLCTDQAIDPRGFYVYSLWGEDEQTPLYVGLSTNLLSRLGSHMGEPAKRRQVRKVTIIKCETESRMKRLEAQMIAHFQPPLNIVGCSNRRSPVAAGLVARRLRERGENL